GSSITAVCEGRAGLPYCWDVIIANAANGTCNLCNQWNGTWTAQNTNGGLGCSWSGTKNIGGCGFFPWGVNFGQLTFQGVAGWGVVFGLNATGQNTQYWISDVAFNPAGANTLTRISVGDTLCIYPPTIVVQPNGFVQPPPPTDVWYVVQHGAINQPGCYKQCEQAPPGMAT